MSIILVVVICAVLLLLFGMTDDDNCAVWLLLVGERRSSVCSCSWRRVSGVGCAEVGCGDGSGTREYAVGSVVMTWVGSADDRDRLALSRERAE